MAEKRRGVWVLRFLAVAVALLLIGGGLWWLLRPSGLKTMPNPAVVAPGGYRTHIDDANTFTVGLPVQNIAEEPLTVLTAKMTAPAGLTATALAIVPAGADNSGLVLSGDLPPATPIILAAGENAVIKARFTVDCKVLLETTKNEPAAGYAESIFVTIQVDGTDRADEIDVPVLGEVPWLTATGTRTCVDPPPTGAGTDPLPPATGSVASPTSGSG